MIIQDTEDLYSDPKLNKAFPSSKWPRVWTSSRKGDQIYDWKFADEVSIFVTANILLTCATHDMVEEMGFGKPTFEDIRKNNL